MSTTPKRPRDPSQLAKAIVDIATGEVEEAPQAIIGSAGGRRRAEMLPAARRVEIAKTAAERRWAAKQSTEDDGG